MFPQIQTSFRMTAGDRMSLPERRFNEDEVAAILQRAMARDEPGRQVLPAGDGLTLAQIQEIGREVGIAPGAIAESALAVDDRAQRTTRRLAGLPLGVERVVQLPRRLTDEEWERVVVELREVFGARGVMRQEGSLRQWTNGNLQVLLEPTADGQRIRLRTFKGSAPGYMTLGLGIFGASAVGIIATVMGGTAGDAKELTGLAMIAATGASVIATTAARLFPWARRRREQMAEVAARVAAMERGQPPHASAIEAGRTADG
jgi:hypothetical protein